MREKLHGCCESTDSTVNVSGPVNMVRHALQRWGPVGALARFLLMRSETRKFIASGSGGLSQARLRELVARFARIQAKVQCAHSPFQFILISGLILDLDVEGPIVECGCFKGGSSAKLSILAEITGRRLIVCDSFAGLPSPRIEKEARLRGFGQSPDYVFSEGEYLGTLEEVEGNIGKYGCLDVCELVPGFFEDSLRDLDSSPACVVIDVDLISSARDCLKHLWPRTSKNGIWFTHEAGFPDYIAGIMDADWWQSTLGEAPPIVFGAGSGLSECAASLAYFVKRTPGLNRPAE